MTSWSDCRSPPVPTPSMSQRSVAMNGICSATCRRITSSRTSSPAAMFVASTRMASAPRNASGSVSRRLALSSSVRSSHWLAAVCAPLAWSEMTNRARPVIRSARIGFRLYAMALEPICSDSNGSSSSPSCCRSRRSPAILDADCAMPLSASSTMLSVFRA